MRIDLLPTGILILVVAALVPGSEELVQKRDSPKEDEHTQHWVKPYANLTGEVRVLRDRILLLELQNMELSARVKLLEERAKREMDTAPYKGRAAEILRADCGSRAKRSW